MSKLNLHPDRFTLRQFGFIATGAFGLMGLLAWQEWLMFGFGLGAARSWVSGACFALACYALTCSLLAPIGNHPLFVGMSLLGYPVGLVVSFTAMAFLFYCVFTPIAVVFRVTKRDVLGRRPDASRESYWIDRSSQTRPVAADYFKQF